jgi:hypothetical protein
VQGHSPYVFPADVGDGHFIGVVRVLDRVCAKAKLSGVTPHVLRHTFASIAGDLGFSELTIAGLLGHSSRGVTQRYVHLDAALAVAADQVSTSDHAIGPATGLQVTPAGAIVRKRRLELSDGHLLGELNLGRRSDPRV